MKMLKNESVEEWLKNVSVDELKIELILKLQRSDAVMMYDAKRTLVSLDNSAKLYPNIMN